MSPTPSQDIATLNIRISNMENRVQQVEERLPSYVPQQVNKIQIDNVQQALDRIEREQQDSKKEQGDQLKEMNTKIDNLKTKNNERLVSLLLGTIGGVLVSVLGTGLVYFFMHIGG